MAKAKTIIVDGITYYSEQLGCYSGLLGNKTNDNSKKFGWPTKENTGDIKIVILQRGWIMVGRFERTGNDCKLHNASVIRSWGTTKGLGEIASNGPTPSTKLDPCNGVVEFDYLTVVAMIACSEEKWSL